MATTILFADDHARIAWTVSQQTKTAVRRMPPENPHDTFKTISFDQKHKSCGFYAILFVGSVGFPSKGKYVVSDRTLKILGKIGIPYEISHP